MGSKLNENRAKNSRVNVSQPQSRYPWRYSPFSPAIFHPAVFPTPFATFHLLAVQLQERWGKMPQFTAKWPSSISAFVLFDMYFTTLKK